MLCAGKATHVIRFVIPLLEVEIGVGGEAILRLDLNEGTEGQNLVLVLVACGEERDFVLRTASQVKGQQMSEWSVAQNMNAHIKADSLLLEMGIGCPDVTCERNSLHA